MPFSITSDTGGLLVLKITGEMDLYAARDLKPELNRLAEENPRHVLMDLTEAEYLDSSTLGLLVGLRKRVLAHGKRMAVAVEGNAIRKLFDLSDLDQLFTLIDGLEETRKHLEGSA